MALIQCSTPSRTPEETVLALHDAFNRRDVEGIVELFSDTFTNYRPHNDVSSSISTLEEIRLRTQSTFQEQPEAHSRSIKRIALGPIVVDLSGYRSKQETGAADDEAITIYEVLRGRISRSWTIGPLPLQEPEDQDAAVALVEKQVEGYNARDLELFSSVYSEDIELVDAKSDEILASGMEQFRQRYVDRFAHSPDLHATILKRIALGHLIVDREQVVRRKGDPLVNAIAVYEIEKGKIRRVWFF